MKEGARSQRACPSAILAAVCDWIIEIRGEHWYARHQLPIQISTTTPGPTQPLSLHSQIFQGSAPTVERSIGVDEEAESAEPQSGPAGRKEMELPPPLRASGELSRLGAYQALGWMLGGR